MRLVHVFVWQCLIHIAWTNCKQQQQKKHVRKIFSARTLYVTHSPISFHWNRIKLTYLPTYTTISMWSKWTGVLVENRKYCVSRRLKDTFSRCDKKLRLYEINPITPQRKINKSRLWSLSLSTGIFPIFVFKVPQPSENQVGITKKECFFYFLRFECGVILMFTPFITNVTSIFIISLLSSAVVFRFLKSVLPHTLCILYFVCGDSTISI